MKYCIAFFNQNFSVPILNTSYGYTLQSELQNYRCGIVSPPGPSKVQRRLLKYNLVTMDHDSDRDFSML